MVEVSLYDWIWGIGLFEDDFRVWNELIWKGKNLFGKILIIVRERLRCDIENVGFYGDLNDLDF